MHITRKSKKRKKYSEIRALAGELGQASVGYAHRRHNKNKTRKKSQRKILIENEEDKNWKKYEKAYKELY